MITSIIPFNNDPLGCYNYIDQKRYYTTTTTGSVTSTINILDFSNTGDSLVSSTFTINCTSIGSSPNIVAYYTGHIIVSITDGVATVVCSNINEVCSESESIQVSIDIDTSSNPPHIYCSFTGVESYTIYWAIEISFKIIDGLADPYCPQPSTYIEGTPGPDENNDPSPSDGPPNTALPPAPEPINNHNIIIPPEPEIPDNDQEDTI